MATTSFDGGIPTSRPRRAVRPRFFVLLAVALAAFVGTKVWNGGSSSAVAQASTSGEKKDKKDEPAPLPVSVAKAVNGPIARHLVASTTVECLRSVDVVARVDGFVSSILVDEGDFVEAGQPLAKLDERELTVEVRKAELNVANLARSLARTEELRRANLMTQSDHDKAMLEHDVAKANLEAARIKLDNATLRAPFSGRVTTRSIEVGQHVKPAQQAFTVQDFSPLVAHVHVPARDAEGVQKGQEVSFVLEARQGENENARFAGRISRISPVVDASTGTVKLRLDLEKPPAAVKPGTYLRVEIVKDVRPDALLVSKRALVYHASSTYVFRTSTDGETVERVPVALGLENDSEVEIVSGLDAGDQVVIVGKEGLKDGAKVRVVS